MEDWSRPALLAMIKDLHDSSAANRDFLCARFQAEDSGEEALEKYRERIVEQFFPRRGFGKLKLAEARKAIRNYRKATGNIAGTIELMLAYVVALKRLQAGTAVELDALPPAILDRAFKGVKGKGSP